MNIWQKLVDYIKSSRLEFKHVNWPTRKNTIKFTALVILVSLFVAAFLGLLDVFFTYILEKFIL
ncbi:MAG: preprotein translocase subunit SecE [Candidatus Niyogibacteria bacterium]|nr:preprotein translocase subunit SecE [Candidatus Niyogibacteria bacterium]